MKPILTAIVVLIITSALFVTCSNDAQTASSATEEIKPAFDIAATKKAIEEANTAYADLVKKGDSTGLAAMYSTDAKNATLKYAGSHRKKKYGKCLCWHASSGRRSQYYHNRCMGNC